MTILGTILAILAAIALSVLLGPFGGVVLVAGLFGLVLSMYMRTREMQEDLQLIKEKLGINALEDSRLEEYLVEKELQRSYHASPAELQEMNDRIERELELDLEPVRKENGENNKNG